jgi:hypothetical protein
LLATIIGALLPIVVVLLLGFFSGWHKDFNGNQATVLNRMVMLYALPLLLFGSTITIPRSRLQADVPLFLAVAAGMVGSFFIALLVTRFVFRRDLGTSALQALTIAGPAVPFVGVSVLGYLFGPANESIPVFQLAPRGFHPEHIRDIVSVTLGIRLDSLRTCPCYREGRRNRSGSQPGSECVMAVSQTCHSTGYSPSCSSRPPTMNSGVPQLPAVVPEEGLGRMEPCGWFRWKR